MAILRLAQNPTMSSKRVLLVENNPRVADLIGERLRSHHLVEDVDVVGDGAQTVEYLLRRGPYVQRPPSAPALILLDFDRENAAAGQLLQRIKSDPRTKTIPVVVLTSSDCAADAAACYDSGANAYVVKPADLRELVDVVGELARFWLEINRPPP